MRTLARGEKDRRTFQDELLDAVREMGERAPNDTFSQVTAALRRKSLGQYALLTLCCFVSVLLITAYAP